MQLFWDQSYALNDGRRMRGTYGYYNVVRFVTIGDIESNNVGLFVQDAWTLNRKLTLNLGVRTESEDVPSYRADNPGVHFDFSDKIAPRAGFAYDVRGDSQWKVYGSWGVFYDLMKLTVGRVMFGGDNWVNYYYTLDSLRLAVDLVRRRRSPAAAVRARSSPSSTSARSPTTRRHPLVDPDLKPARSQELTFGMDHELTRTMSLGVRYAHKWIDYAIEAVCNFTPSGEEDCGVNNPGFGSELGTYPLGRNNPAQPAAVRDYDGIEVRLRKRLANRWSADVSYLYSKLRGNWSGIASSDEAVSSLQPNSGRSFNLLYYSYDTQGNVTDGRSGTDRPHQFKAQGTYDLPWGTLVGVNAIVQSGIPRSTIMSQKNINFFPFGRGDLGRTPTYSQVDLLVQQEIRLPGDLRVTVGVNAINLFDQKTVSAVQHDAVPRRLQRRRFDVLRRLRSGGRGDGAELPPRRAARHGERLSGLSRHQAAGQVHLLARAASQVRGVPEPGRHAAVSGPGPSRRDLLQSRQLADLMSSSHFRIAATAANRSRM